MNSTLLPRELRMSALNLVAQYFNYNDYDFVCLQAGDLLCSPIELVNALSAYKGCLLASNITSDDTVFNSITRKYYKVDIEDSVVAFVSFVQPTQELSHYYFSDLSSMISDIYPLIYDADLICLIDPYCKIDFKRVSDIFPNKVFLIGGASVFTPDGRYIVPHDFNRTPNNWDGGRSICDVRVDIFSKASSCVVQTVLPQIEDDAIFSDITSESLMLQTQQITDYISSSYPVDAYQYIGVKACIECHANELVTWQSTPHAKALEHLQEIVDTKGSPQSSNSNCLVCHTTYFPFNEILGIRSLRTRGVSCEACHGPGKRHQLLHQGTVPVIMSLDGEFKKQEEYIEIPNGTEYCSKCHTKAHSPNFEYTTYISEVDHVA